MDIRPVAESQRTLRGIDFFVLWTGVAISLAEIWAGGFLAPMGFWMGLWAILLGHVIGNTFMSLGGIVGSQYGIMSMVSIRPSFGIRGSRIAAVLNIVQLIGWASIMLIIAGRAGAVLGASVGGVLASDYFWIAVIGMGTLVWALFTGGTIWKYLQNISVLVLLVIVGAMSVISFGEFSGRVTAPPAGGMPFMTGLDLVIAMPISWLPLVADYSRFAKNTRTAFWNTWIGYFIVSSWMYILGLAAALVTGTTDPALLILEIMGSIGLAVPALIMVIFSTITSDFPDVYSATCSVLNITSRISAKVFMWIAGTLSILVALVFPMAQYENFLLFIGAMFVPLFGVVLTDYFIIRKGKLEVDELFKAGGAYWYFRGFHVKGILSWVAGFMTFELMTIMKYSVGASLPSMAVAGLCYWLMARSEK